MICKNYVVSGEDVNDSMVMESTAYISYTLRLLDHFLFANGFSKERLKALQLGLQEGHHQLVPFKDLMFTESFFVEMKQCYIADKILMESCFFNSRNECCAVVTKEVEWFDPVRSQVIAAPKQILRHFNARNSA